MEFLFEEVTSGGGAGKDGFVRFVAGTDVQVVVLTGARKTKNRYNESKAKLSCGIWNIKEKKVQIMDLKSTIGDVIKMVAATKPDWSKTVFTIKRTGTGQTDTRYTVINSQAANSMPDFEARCKEADELISKVLFSQPDEEAQILGIKI